MFIYIFSPSLTLAVLVVWVFWVLGLEHPIGFKDYPKTMNGPKQFDYAKVAAAVVHEFY